MCSMSILSTCASYLTTAGRMPLGLQKCFGKRLDLCCWTFIRAILRLPNQADGVDDAVSGVRGIGEGDAQQLAIRSGLLARQKFDTGTVDQLEKSGPRRLRGRSVGEGGSGDEEGAE